MDEGKKFCFPEETHRIIDEGKKKQFLKKYKHKATKVQNTIQRQGKKKEKK